MAFCFGHGGLPTGRWCNLWGYASFDQCERRVNGFPLVGEWLLPEPPGRCGKQKKASSSFLQKKNQKTPVHKALAFPQRVRQMDKSFCFFFQKEVRSSCRCVSLKATW
jgi:hypothetical protein